MHDNVLVVELISVVFANALRIILVVGVNAMLKILASMVILKQVADQTIPQPLFVTTEGIVSVENVNVTQEKILWRWFLEIIVNATTFLATAIMESFALVPIKESANAESVFVTQNGTVQDTLPANVELLMTHVSHHTGSL